MKLKSLGLLALCSAIVVVLSACQPVGPLREGLNFEKSVFAKVDDAGKITFLESVTSPASHVVPEGSVASDSQKAEYERGETVHFALMKVGKFKKGEDGKHWVDSELKVRQGSKMIFERKNLLGEAGHVELKDDEAESPTGVFTATASLKPGDYSMELTVYDKIGGGKARDTGVFTVK
jgi:hypothetical protein